MTQPPTILYGDFSCPWTYLAHRRLALLRTAGDTFELRAVEHDPWRAVVATSPDDEFEDLRGELDRVRSYLLPGEDLPEVLRGFVPHTRAAVSGFGEAYGGGVADIVGPMLFDAFWRHGLDLDDPVVVRTLVADAIQSGCSPSDPLRRWGHAVAVTGGPMTTLAWRLVRAWRQEWTSMDKQVVPVLVLPDGAVRYGTEAVEHLGREVLDRGLDPGTELVWPEPGPRPPVDGYGRAQVLYPLDVA